MRPRLLDFYSGAGGAAAGWHRAGFDVTGIDINPQPNYPFEFIQADAIEVLTKWRRFLKGFDAYHASPPCQPYSAMTSCRPGLASEYPDLVGATRNLLKQTGRPYVIENVPGAPLAEASDLFGAHGTLLCGHMFGLKLYRHRIFEASFPLPQPHHPRHLTPASKAGHWEPGTIVSVSGNCAPIALAREAMGIDWMTRDELAESIPPAYTEYIGEQLLEHLRSDAA